MLVTFSASNFRSFASEETLSLVASGRLAGSHDSHTTPIPNSREQVLKTAVLYGANGAGKSNLVKALALFKKIALKTRPKHAGMARQAFRFGDIEGDASSFDLQFIANSKLFRLGFKLNDQAILEEWLVQVTGKKEKIIYERVTDADGRVKIDAPGLKGSKLRALATIGGPQNQSFLATIRATLDEADLDPPLQTVIDWLNHGLTLITPDTDYPGLASQLATETDFLRFASDFLHDSSTGISGLHVQRKELSEEELHQLLPEGLVRDVLAKLPETSGKKMRLPLGSGSEIVLEDTDQPRYYQVNTQAIHQQATGKTIPLDLTEESDGTRRLLDLIPALHDIAAHDGVYVIDEIDRSLHPMLVRKFLECFFQSCAGGHRQIIVTTHESSLLDLDLLRRDEIWFAEKDSAHATHLYSLADFKVRNDLEIRKHYMQGRFGAVPFLGNLTRLMEPAVKAA